MSGRQGSNLRPSAWQADALPTELLPHNVFFNSTQKDLTDLSSVLDLNQRRVVIIVCSWLVSSPSCLFGEHCLFGAEDETRTRNPLLGRQALYQLSYFRILWSVTLSGYPHWLRFHKGKRLYQAPWIWSFATYDAFVTGYIHVYSTSPCCWPWYPR
jgi:hypothetical protein